MSYTFAHFFYLALLFLGGKDCFIGNILDFLFFIDTLNTRVEKSWH
jgi:hypothetical protein